MVIWTNWSGSFRGFVNNIFSPVSLAELRKVVSGVNGKETFLHAQGSKWAFSSPAYCGDVMISTDNLKNFPRSLQVAVNPSQEPDKFRIAVEAGIKVRHLYTALAARVPLTLPPPGGTPVPNFLSAGDGWTLPTLGGAGGQSIAGVISTGTHGGDVASPPLSDAVLAMLIVGEGGALRLVQRPPRSKGPPVVDVRRLESELSTELGESVNVEDLSTSNDILDAAVVSEGRFGIVYAYVLEIISEKGKVVIEDRTRSTWNTEKQDLLTKVSEAEAHKEFLQIVINPHQRNDTDHTCYVTTHRIEDGDPTDAGPPPIEIVVNARQSRFEPLMQNVCGATVTPELLTIQGLLIEASVHLIATGVGNVLAIPLLRAAESIGRIGPDHLIGDAIADVLNLVTDVGLPGVVEMVTAAMLDGGQRDWTVKGTRFEIADFFDYDHDCYRGDSVELFFEVNSMLPSKIEAILQVFKELRSRGIAIGAYVSLRFMAKSRALLGLAHWSPTCSVEISMLRGLLGNTEALIKLQEVAVNNDGRVHWGQQNDLSQRQIETQFGIALDKWRRMLEDLEGTSLLFSTPFTRQHGLEVQLRNPDWLGWQPLNLVSQNSPWVVSALDNEPLEIFSQNSSRQIVSRKRPIDGSDTDWRTVHDHVKGRPVAVRSQDRRIELFVLFPDNRIKHCWQEGRPGGQWSSWDTLGFGDIGEIDSDPSIAAHTDGRLELFARSGGNNNWRLFHCWAHWTNGLWSNFGARGNEQIFSMPSVCHRSNFNSDQLVVVTKDEEGRVIEKHQVGVSGDSGWSEWTEILPSLGDRTSGSPIAIDVYGTGATVHILTFDNHGQLKETLEQARTLNLSWGPWESLPSTPVRLDKESRLCSVQTDRLYLFGMSLQGEVLVCEFHPGIGWSNWQNLGGEFAGSLAAGVLDTDGRIEVVGRARSNQLMARRQTSPGTW